MSCRQTGLKKEFVPYLEGTLSARKAGRLERHVRDCEECRAEIARLRTGDAAARRLRVQEEDSERRAPGIAEILADPAEPSSGINGWIRRWEIRFAALTTPRAVLILALIVLGLIIALGLSRRGLLSGGRASEYFWGDSSAAGEFHPLKVSEVAANKRPRIAVEGFVRDVRLDKEEKILRFKLTEKPSEAEPFVVCEILDPSAMVIPREGDRVRVYGVARYDAQPGREWYEVNPVMSISVIKD
jgi:hypothetical protein